MQRKEGWERKGRDLVDLSMSTCVVLPLGLRADDLQHHDDVCPFPPPPFLPCYTCCPVLSPSLIKYLEDFHVEISGA